MDTCDIAKGLHVEHILGDQLSAQQQHHFTMQNCK